MRRLTTVATVAFCLFATAARLSADIVLVEAESFKNPGGWVIDQQSMDQMGSPYLLAHGLGVPVKDAATTATFSATGQYAVYVRTRDWVAPHGPGKFKVEVDGKALDATFGAEGDGKWFWQKGGTVEIGKAQVEIALKDLTGFEGRCDAIVFVKGEAGFVPPNDLKGMAPFRRKALGLPDTPRDAGKFDLVVVGGGIAGTCAAVSAARLDLKVALVQDRPVLGGNNSSEVQVWMNGGTTVGPFPRNGDIPNEIGTRSKTYGGNGKDYLAGDERRLKVVQAEKNISLFLNTHAYAVEKQKDRITAVVTKNVITGEELKFSAPLFVDGTGDGTIGFLAGADYRYGSEGKEETGEAMAHAKPDKTHMGGSNLWVAVQEAGASTFPACPWALKVTEENLGQSLDKALLTRGEWHWESGFAKDTIEDAEYIRDHNFRAMYGTWDFLKNRSSKVQEYKNWRLAWAAYISGRRESRRLLGDHILTQQDIIEKKAYPDACFTTTWSLDLHYPTKLNSKYFPGEEFRSYATTGARIQPYEVPFRCLYSRNVRNLMMAGRDISVTHVALGTVRVMGTCGLMGTVVGKAAYLCKKYDVEPRDIYEKHLEEFKDLLRGSKKP
jgi:hypothetical protein